MRKLYRFVLLVVCITVCYMHAVAQTGNQPVKVAVFAPLYLEDAFNGSTYKLGKSNLPKNVLPGLEFYNGVMMAIDSLSNEGANVEINIYDLKDPLLLERFSK